MITLYKSTDASSPQMTSAAGSLLAVLDACLVNGYGSKAAAGWSKTVIDAPTYQATYTQGAGAGLAQKKVYIKDNASTPGNATAWACDSCTVAAAPVLTNYFWDVGNSYIGVIVKADQDNAQFAKWIILASERWVYLFTKRSGWGSRGYQLTFFGDLESAYPADKGKFAVMGFNSNNGPEIALGGGNRNMSSDNVCVYGNQDGTYNPIYYNRRRALGDISGYADKLSPRNSLASGFLLGKIFFADQYRYRGSLPQAYRSTASLDYFSWYMLPDEYVLPNADASKSYLHIQFGGTTTGTTEPGRLFLDITGVA